MTNGLLKYTKYDEYRWSVWLTQFVGNRGGSYSTYLGSFVGSENGSWTLLMDEGGAGGLTTYVRLQLQNALERLQKGEPPMTLG